MKKHERFLSLNLFSMALAGTLLLAGMPAFAASAAKETEDRDKNGKTDTWIERDAQGRVVSVARDKHVDGKPDQWVYYLPDGTVERREWDRNFDRKADFRTKETRGRLIEKEYDDNFDGIFEKKEKPPAKGSSGKTPTRPRP